MNKYFKTWALLVASLLVTLCMAWAEEESAGGNTVDGHHFQVTAQPIFYGMHLQESALMSAGSTVTVDGETVPADTVGTFRWQDGAVTPDVGTGSHSAVFVPFEEMDYAFPYVDVQVQVQKARPVIAAPPAASPLVYGQSLSQSTLTGGTAVNPYSGAMENVQGVFEWELRDMVPSVGRQDCTVVFTPIINAADYYEPLYFSVQVDVEKQKTVVAQWPTVSGQLTYGDALGSLTLSGGSARDEWGEEVSGTFRFADEQLTPASGTHQVQVVFVPQDHAHRQEVYGNVQVDVKKAPVTAAAGDVEITYGDVLSDALIYGEATDGNGRTVPGAFAFVQQGQTPSVSESGMKDVIFTPDDQENYESSHTQVQVRVRKAQVTVAVGENGKYKGEKDGAFAYSVQGLPEGAALVGDLYRDAGEESGTYKVYADKLSLPAELEENYTLHAENGTFEIRVYEQPVRAMLAVREGDNGWLKAGVMEAPDGFTVSLEEQGPYQNTLVLPDGKAGAAYYMKVLSGDHAGAVCGPYHVEYRLDTTPPGLEVNWLDGNEFTLNAWDDMSGVDRIYGLFAGPAQSYAGVGEATYAYAAREAGNYTYVVYDLAGNSAVITLEFPDTDGDGLTDAYEMKTGTDINRADSDFDGVTDFDARRIRNLLGYDKLDVTAAVLLGALHDAGMKAVELPKESIGLVTVDELSVPRDNVRTGRGLMRMSGNGAWGLTGDILWYERADGVYSALHMENISGDAALSPNAPDGVIALAAYDGAALDDIRIADMRTGRVYIVAGTAGAGRFDLSPDGQYLAWSADGKTAVVNLVTGELESTLALDGECVFLFDGENRIRTENACAVLEKGVWQVREEKCILPVQPLCQPVRGSAVVRILGRGEQYVVKALGTAVNTDAGAYVVLQGGCTALEKDADASHAQAMAESVAISDARETTFATRTDKETK